MLEAAMQKTERRRVAVSRRVEVFHEFAKYHLEWMGELLAWYKLKGNMPNFAVFRLPMYYSDKRDEEIAAFAASLLGEGAKFNELHDLIGQRPWDWFTSRDFVLLGMGDRQNKTTSGCPNWKISAWMNRLFQAVNENSAESVEDAVDADAWRWGLSAEDVLMRYAEEAGIGYNLGRIRLLLLALSDNDMLGHDVWQMREPLKCPFTAGVKSFLKMWCPDTKNFGTKEYCTTLFSMDAGDFLLSYYAYLDLCRLAPLECRRYSTLYLKWYRACERKKRCQWKMIQPKIPSE